MKSNHLPTMKSVLQLNQTKAIFPSPVKHCNFPSFFIKPHDNLNQFAFPQEVKKNLDSTVKAIGNWLQRAKLRLKSKYPFKSQLLCEKKPRQHAKKVVSDSLGLGDFAIRLVNAQRASEVFWRIQITEELSNQSVHQNAFGASWNDVWASKC